MSYRVEVFKTEVDKTVGNITLKSCCGSSNLSNDSKRVFRCDVKISVSGCCDGAGADGYCCNRCW